MRFIFLRIFLVSEFVFISWVFFYNIKNKLLKQIIRITPFFFTAYSIYNYIKTPAGEFDFKPLAAECLILLIYILYFFYEKIQITTSIPVYQTKIFWIAVAFIIYCSGNFFLFLYSNKAVKNAEFGFQFTIIYSTFAILKNLALCTGLLVKQLPEPKQHPDFLTQATFTDDFGLSDKGV